MKLSDASPSASQRGRENQFEGVPRHGHQHQRSRSPAPSVGLGQSAMASAFAKLQNKG